MIKPFSEKGFNVNERLQFEFHSRVSQFMVKKKKIMPHFTSLHFTSLHQLGTNHILPALRFCCNQWCFWVIPILSLNLWLLLNNKKPISHSNSSLEISPPEISVSSQKFAIQLAFSLIEFLRDLGMTMGFL